MIFQSVNDKNPGLTVNLQWGFHMACADSRQKYHIAWKIYSNNIDESYKIYLFFTETSLQKVHYLSIVFKMAGKASNGGLPQCTNAVKKTCFGKYQTIGVLSKHKLGYLKQFIF